MDEGDGKKRCGYDAVGALHHRPSFWRFYQDAKGLLLDYANTLSSQSKSFYPWTVKDIESGMIERPYMAYLAQHHPWAVALEKNANLGISILPDFALLSLKYNSLSLRQTRELETVFARFHVKQNYIHAFLMGQTNHWITVIVNKVEGKIETVLADSRNQFSLEWGEEEIEADITSRLTGFQVESYIRSFWTLSVRDIQFTVPLLHSWALGECGVLSRLLELNIGGFMERWREVMGEKKEEGDNSDDFLTKLMYWLEVYYPPAVIECNVIRVLKEIGVEKIPDQVKKDLIEWTRVIAERAVFGEDGVYIVKRFKKTWNWFKTVFLTV